MISFRMFFMRFVWIALTAPVFSSSVVGQNQTIYTVDPTFNSSNLFRSYSGISTIVPYDDGRILVAGSFSSFPLWSPFNGLGMVWGDGSEYTQWGGAQSSVISQVALYQDGFLAAAIGGLGRNTADGTHFFLINGHRWIEYQWPNNPYNLESIWCVYVQEDDKVLIGGAIATDTTQPYLFRNLMRVLPDGSHDTTFPVIEIEPNNKHSEIIRIHKNSQGKWLISGNFYAVNGHESAFIARLNQDFSVDTAFISPLKFVPSMPEPHIVLLDSQDRMWLSGRRMVTYDNPSDTINVLRVFSSGNIDTIFRPKRVDEDYPPGINLGNYSGLYGGEELEGSDHYILYGKFNYFNDTLQPCITVVDNAGSIQENYFQNMGASEQNYHTNTHTAPYIGAVVELADGNLIVGGAFSKFMGVTHYSLVKLNRSTIKTKDFGFDNLLSVYPNPANGSVKIKISGSSKSAIRVFDLSGRIVYNETMYDEESEISTEDFAPGIYFVQVDNDRNTLSRKFVVK